MKLGITGRRPKSLPVKNPYSEKTLNQLKETITNYINSLPEKPTELISGLGLGWDTAAAEAAIEINIPLTAVLPHEGHGSKWPKESQNRLNQLLKKADKIITTSKGGYSAEKMMKRNDAMLDMLDPNNDQILALWDGKESGGTYDYLKKAQKRGIKITNLWQEFTHKISQNYPQRNNTINQVSDRELAKAIIPKINPSEAKKIPQTTLSISAEINPKNNNNIYYTISDEAQMTNPLEIEFNPTTKKANITNNNLTDKEKTAVLRSLNQQQQL